MKIDHIIKRYYNADLNKYFVLARVVIGNVYSYRRIPFNTREEAYKAKEGDWVK